jgi:hypothetical protein
MVSVAHNMSDDAVDGSEYPCGGHYLCYPVVTTLSPSGESNL